MRELFVELHSLRPGLTLGEDVFVNTNFPIIKKNTNLTAEHIEVLQIFNVKRVKIKNKAVVVPEKTDEVEETKELSTQEIMSLIKSEKTPLKESYIEAAGQFKKEFTNWRLGVKPDIANVRSIIMPLFEKLEDENDNGLSFLSHVSNVKEYLYYHSVAVGLIAYAIGKKLKLPKGQIIQLGIAGALIDCGMSKINSSIVEKTAFLTEAEFNEVKKHAIYSYQLVKDSPLLRTEMKQAILQHHERLNGSGYPRGDNHENISLYSQILAIADVYHAMTSERLYRTKQTPFKVLELLREEEFGKFNIKVINALCDVIGKLTIGSEVKLSNGQKGIVLFVHQDTPYRPTVKLDDEETIVDLTKKRDLAVEAVL